MAGGRRKQRHTTMNKFQVWLRPLGSACRVRVDRSDNALWLLARLRRSHVAAISEVLNDNRGSPRSTFQVDYDTRTSRPEFEQLLSSIPEVEVMLDPA